MKKFAAGAIAGLLLLSICAFGTDEKQNPSSDPWLGTWKLVLKKSSFKPGPARREATLVITNTGWTYNEVNAEGKPFTASFSSGKLDCTTCDAGASWEEKQLDPRSREAVLKQNGKVLMTNHNVLAPNGKTIKITSTGKNDKGQEYTNITVYAKAK